MGPLTLILLLVAASNVTSQFLGEQGGEKFSDDHGAGIETNSIRPGPPPPPSLTSYFVEAELEMIEAVINEQPDPEEYLVDSTDVDDPEEILVTYFPFLLSLLTYLFVNHKNFT